MAIAAVPKRARPHQPDEPAPGIDSMKEKLIKLIACGDANGADKLRKQMQLDQAARDATQATTQPTNSEHSFVSWTNEEGKPESIELTATPEASEYFAQITEIKAAS